ncbi:MAG: helix-turn-helix transcriptional regulator [Polyangiaceae bacterium]|nr:helix-turn-helix transcriptional regulator [Polyangiaceae bacterium]MCE7889640.1 LuxR family transcriptional regulator [Sorangiineae bacterium PRO1]MCL4755558.1 helix-turn-helix transcriptional regulator [Myxococcales bacterium]
MREWKQIGLAPEVAELRAPLGLRASSFSLGDEEYLVLSYPAPQHGLPKTLTATEREVARGLLGGLTNNQIARERGVAVRTVANQVAAVLKKTGVSSRIELVRKLAT